MSEACRVSGTTACPSDERSRHYAHALAGAKHTQSERKSMIMQGVLGISLCLSLVGTAMVVISIAQRVGVLQ